MKKETLLLMGIVCLLLLNLTTLGFLFWRQPGGHGRPENRMRHLDQKMTETLGWNAAQIDSFTVFKQAHHEKIKAADQAYRNALEQYFALLTQPETTLAQQDSLEKVLSSIQIVRAQVTYAHFKDLKRICTPEQQQKFDTLLPELMNVILPPNRKRR
jgi:protein CpxP